MTLLGKIFRPWDLPIDSPESIEDKKEPDLSSSAISTIEKSPIRNQSVQENSNSNNNNSDNNNKKQEKLIFSNDTHHHHQNHHISANTNTNFQGTSLPNLDLLGRRENPSNINPQIYSNFDFMNFFSGDESSPSPGSSSSSNMFFYPTNAINELASLSRSELTALGLLPPELPSSSKIKRVRPKRFHCPECNVAFSNNGQLKGHLRIHSGERPYVCEVEGCKKSFTRNEELTRHRRIHSGIRPFSCNFCGKKFGRKDHLKKHTRCHQRAMFNGIIGYTPNPFIPLHTPMVFTHAQQHFQTSPFQFNP